MSSLSINIIFCLIAVKPVFNFYFLCLVFISVIGTNLNHNIDTHILKIEKKKLKNSPSLHTNLVKSFVGDRSLLLEVSNL